MLVGAAYARSLAMAAYVDQSTSLRPEETKLTAEEAERGDIAAAYGKGCWLDIEIEPGIYSNEDGCI